MYTEDHLTSTHKENIETFLFDLLAQITQNILAARGLTASDMEGVFDMAILSADDAKKKAS